MNWEMFQFVATSAEFKPKLTQLAENERFWVYVLGSYSKFIAGHLQNQYPLFQNYYLSNILRKQVDTGRHIPRNAPIPTGLLIPALLLRTFSGFVLKADYTGDWISTFSLCCLFTLANTFFFGWIRPNEKGRVSTNETPKSFSGQVKTSWKFQPDNPKYRNSMLHYIECIKWRPFQDYINLRSQDMSGPYQDAWPSIARHLALGNPFVTYPVWQ